MHSTCCLLTLLIQVQASIFFLQGMLLSQLNGPAHDDVRLNTSPSSLHTTRRIWQEAITTLLLTTPSCAIPEDQAMCFAQAKGSEFPPYLLNFQGSPSERHVENLKVTTTSVYFSSCHAMILSRFCGKLDPSLTIGRSRLQRVRITPGIDVWRMRFKRSTRVQTATGRGVQRFQTVQAFLEMPGGFLSRRLLLVTFYPSFLNLSNCCYRSFSMMMDPVQFYAKRRTWKRILHRILVPIYKGDGRCACRYVL